MLRANLASVTRGDSDVIVAGSGIGGLVASLSAHSMGLGVQVIEKSALLGGTTAHSEAMVWVPCSRQAKAAGVIDSRDAALRYLHAAAGVQHRAELAQAYVDTAAEALAFVEDRAPVRWTLTTSSIDYHSELYGATRGAGALSPEAFDGRRLGALFARLRPPLDTTMILGGMSINGADLPHYYRVFKSLPSNLLVGRRVVRYLADRLRGFPRGTAIGGGNGVVAGLLLALQSRGVAVRPATEATGLWVDAGRVVGVKVAGSQGELQLRTRRGVVLACGGFPHDAERLRGHYAHVAAGQPHHSLSATSNMGDGIRMALAVGAQLVSNVQHAAAWAPASLVPTPRGIVPFPHFGDRAKPGVIAVDRRGRRFVSEATTYHLFVPAMVEACRGDTTAEAHLLADYRAQRRYGLGVAPPFPGAWNRTCARATWFAQTAWPSWRSGWGSMPRRCKPQWTSSIATPSAVRTRSFTRAATPRSAATVIRSIGPIPVSRRCATRRSTPCASCRATSASSSVCTPMLQGVYSEKVERPSAASMQRAPRWPTRWAGPILAQASRSDPG